MDKFDRIFVLHGIFSTRRTAIDQEELLARFECKRSMLFRILALMKDCLGALVVYDSEQGGWRYTGEAGTYELLGLWLNAAELQALAVIQKLLHDFGGGILDEKIALLAKRIDHLMKHQRLQLGEVATRLRFPALAVRVLGDAFQVAASVILQRKKLWFQYRARSSDAQTDR